MKKIDYIFIESCKNKACLEGCTQVASFAPELMEVAQQAFKSYKKSLENSENDCYLCIQYQDGNSKKLCKGVFKMLESKGFDSSEKYKKALSDFIFKLTAKKKRIDFSKLWLICLNYSDANANNINDFSFMVGIGMNICAEWKLVYKG